MMPDFRIIQILNFRKIRTLACCQRKMCALVTLGNRPARLQGLTCNITMWSACWITLIQIFFYYNISFFNVNRKIKFYFCIIIHYLKRYSIIAAVTLSLSFIDIMFDIITFLSSPDVNNL